MEGPVPEFVIRLADVALSREELESTIGVGLDRYEPSRRGTSHYAQVSLSDTVVQWPAVVEFLERVAPRIADLISHRIVGSASIDFAIYAKAETLLHSVKVPAQVASLAGQNLISLEMSFYLVADAD